MWITRQSDDNDSGMRHSPGAPDLRPFYLLVVVIGGIAAHLASEFAAMGSDASSLLFSPRHWYLGLAVVAGVVYLAGRVRALRLQSSSRRDFKRGLRIGLSDLPFGGRGAAFYAFTAALQFAVGMSTEVGEGAPIAGHDVVAGIVGALLVVLALLFATKAVARTLPAIVAVLMQLLPSSGGASDEMVAHSRRAVPLLRRPTWYPNLLNRPPPPLQPSASL